MARTSLGGFTLLSSTLIGVEACPVSVEVVVTMGLPGFHIVGIPDVAVRESQERVRSAIKASGFIMPADKVVVNLAPSAIRKSGSGFDLPIAVAILAATGQIPKEGLDVNLWTGELSLEGDVRPSIGILAYELCAQRLGLNLVCSASCDDLARIEGLKVLSLRTLRQLTSGGPEPWAGKDVKHEPVLPDFGRIRGNAFGKRAMEIAAAGGHGVLMMGPPGSGKTMLARALPSILPPLSEEERIETAVIHSVAGLDPSGVLSGERPFRTPHHSSSLVGLIGGGNPIHPGEISLAHNGVLFLDELPEFSPRTLQSLRQPMEDGYVSIVRSSGRFSMPSRFMLVAAANPCPCGYYGDPERRCGCTFTQVRNYKARIGGPLLDRFDMTIEVMRPRSSELIDEGAEAEGSQAMKDRVCAAREFSSFRRERQGGPRMGGRLSVSDALGECGLEDGSVSLVRKTAESTHMSGRALTRVLMVARTIADLAEKEHVGEDHFLEAMAFRIREEQA